MKNLIYLIFLFAAGCTVYQSGGRAAIEKNQSNLVGTYSTGYDAKLEYYYKCSTSVTTPDFLKEPLEVVESIYEQKNRRIPRRIYF